MSKPLVDAMGELIAEYGRDSPCRICACVREEGHAESCPWEVLKLWASDVQAMIEAIRTRWAPIPPDRADPVGIPKEITEERRRT